MPNRQARDIRQHDILASAMSLVASSGPLLMDLQAKWDAKRTGLRHVPSTVAGLPVSTPALRTARQTESRVGCRCSAERLFLRFTASPASLPSAEHLGALLGLDIFSLYEVAAEVQLLRGQFPQAVRLYQLSKVSHVALASVDATRRLRAFDKKLAVSFSPERLVVTLAFHCYQVLCNLM